MVLGNLVRLGDLKEVPSNLNCSVKMEEDDVLITTPHPIFLLQLSFRKIRNPTAVQKDNCTRAELGEEVLPFHHQLPEKGTLTT